MHDFLHLLHARAELHGELRVSSDEGHSSLSKRTGFLRSVFVRTLKGSTGNVQEIFRE